MKNGQNNVAAHKKKRKKKKKHSAAQQQQKEKQNDGSISNEGSNSDTEMQDVEVSPQ